MRLLVFGYGFTGKALKARLAPQGWSVTAALRPGAEPPEDVSWVSLDDPAGLAAAVAAADAVLVAAPPGSEGCPGLAALSGPLAEARPGWIGYLSTTGVYGDRQGRWVFEDSRLTARSAEGLRRVAAEDGWRAFTASRGLPLAVFRLPGIYGPGRSAFDRLRAGQARRLTSPGHVFSRIHVDDLAAGLAASIARPRAGAAYNLCDDEPAPNSEVIAYAARLLGMEPPPEVALADVTLPPSALRFWAESKRVSNARAKAELGWRPAYPTYREGLAAVLAAGG